MFERFIETEDPLVVPMTDGLYKISVDGTAVDKYGKVAESSVDASGQPIVNMYLWNGWGWYPVALVVAHTYKPVHCAFVLWKQLSLMYIDGNVKNIHPSNLVWKYPVKGLPHALYPGYVYIPGYSRYVINQDGVVIRHKSGNHLKSYIGSNGYYLIRLDPDIGKSTIIGIHRLLCLAFYDYSANVDKLVTNHINGIKSDNRLVNLELTTYKGNIVHAYANGLRSDNVHLLVRNVITGEVNGYYSKSSCNDALGLGSGVCTYRAKQPGQPLYPGYLQFKLATDPSPWRDVSDPDAELSDGRFHIPVLTKDVVTGIVTEYPNISACAVAAAITDSAVAYRLETNQSLFPGNLIYRYKDDPVPWREITDLESEIKQMEFNGYKESRSVLCRNVKTNDIIEYSSLRQMTNVTGISRNVRSKILDISQPLYPGYLQFKYKDNQDPWRDPVDLETEELMANEAFGSNIPVKVRNIFTGEVRTYVSIAEATTELNLSKKIADRCINRTNSHPVREWDFKRQTDLTPWRDFTDRDLKMYALYLSLPVSIKNGQKGYSVIDLTDDSEMMFTDIDGVATFLNTDYRSIKYHVKCNKTFQNRYTIKHYFE